MVQAMIFACSRLNLVAVLRKIFALFFQLHTCVESRRLSLLQEIFFKSSNCASLMSDWLKSIFF